MRIVWLKVLLVALVVLLPGALLFWWTALPGEVRLPSGPLGGQHEIITENLRAAIAEKLGAKTPPFVSKTHGSLENLGGLQRGELDFALYQAGAACFVDMCQDLSQKINEKITRQRLDRQLDRLTGVVDREASRG